MTDDFILINKNKLKEIINSKERFNMEFKKQSAKELLKAIENYESFQEEETIKKKQLKITIEGVTGSGKTFLANLIQNYLLRISNFKIIRKDYPELRFLKNDFEKSVLEMYDKYSELKKYKDLNDITKEIIIDCKNIEE